MFWYIDPSHSHVSFSVKHMMVSTVRGRLGNVSGKIDLDPSRPEKASFTIAASVTGIDTGDPKRDGHLRSADFFDAERYPEIVFKSDAIFPKGEGRYTASGQLTIRGVTRPVSFDIDLEGIGENGQGGRVLGASAVTTIDRTAFGLTWNMPVPNGVLVSEKVKIEVDLEAIDEASAKQRGLAA
ncbi:MAG TPA: YceI family protein [Candidatus Limnocylindria bacterium]|nr:YceI family protein [Candidatus Limnocylindria bacterium]